VRRIFALPIVLTSAVVLAACASESNEKAADPHPESIATSGARADEDNLGFTLPEEEEMIVDVRPDTYPAALTLVTWGSSACPTVPTSVSWAGPSTIVLAITSDYGDQACTADMVPWASVVELPPRKEGGEITEVRVEGKDVKFLVNGAEVNGDGDENGADEDGDKGDDGDGDDGDEEADENGDDKDD